MDVIWVYIGMIIYKTINLINGKIYIGKDVKNSPTYFGSGIYFKNALQKYGKENFIKETIETCDDIKKLSEREIYWIKFFNATDRTIGYNLSDGGQGGNLEKFKGPSPNLGKTYEELYGEKKAKELKEQSRLRWLGEKNYMFGKKLSKEHIDKIKLANTGKKKGPLSKEHKETLRMANIGKKASLITKQKMSQARKGLEYPGVTVKQIDEFGCIINTFDSISKAAKFLKVHRNKILRNTVKDFNIILERRFIRKKKQK